MNDFLLQLSDHGSIYGMSKDRVSRLCLTNEVLWFPPKNRNRDTPSHSTNVEYLQFIKGTKAYNETEFSYIWNRYSVTVIWKLPYLKCSFYVQKTNSNIFQNQQILHKKMFFSSVIRVLWHQMASEVHYLPITIQSIFKENFMRKGENSLSGQYLEKQKQCNYSFSLKNSFIHAVLNTLLYNDFYFINEWIERYVYALWFCRLLGSAGPVNGRVSLDRILDTAGSKQINKKLIPRFLAHAPTQTSSKLGSSWKSLLKTLQPKSDLVDGLTNYYVVLQLFYIS